MKVILLQDIENIGKKYEIKEVKDGYARNFLIPKDLAKLATKKALQWLEEQKETVENEAEEDLKKTQEVASKIDGIELSIAVKTGPDNQLFESINNVKISEKLKELGYEIKKSQINLEKPIKELGEFPIKISLDHNLEPEIKLFIIKEKE
ncbi:MAG: 50S ribosomal protein L9 [Parcubacteria group bacterium GW2011_GWA1_33_6]|uniref:Large ribosomal subunit protein bL9 n=1 Tax=Candidatus Staskawiczbacteria bacterium RIFCSPHIGHO2_02_FULL_33_16 TaxID=1802204 RepID=A0A1G2HT43_9BACT|nr:MAG: 50S ribosomal protein L9 [Parcubacteria group bacterium GW2011_GWA2_33_14]KKP55640.1 MAG: 50S ribosomal protein L9 [Parcubacteria group bacterium GW2011_GWA1_33_6]OGZ65605.1 MAG: 50S ribosomal protein L9 [Candidatus Staskawiczbacteria bacterium RIFCSPHIGHO2_02_FULL_33_16]OGZ71112.1 MAG: 50S ribosomal protein L9 [Candidatus Staskawiczbacteria bacterium RIFCSPLOWO2_01_FULL_33_13]